MDYYSFVKKITKTDTKMYTSSLILVQNLLVSIATMFMTICCIYLLGLSYLFYKAVVVSDVITFVNDQEWHNFMKLSRLGSRVSVESNFLC